MCSPTANLLDDEASRPSPAVALAFVDDMSAYFADRHHWLALSGRHPTEIGSRTSLAERLQQQRIGKHRASGRMRRTDFSNHAVAIGDQHRRAANDKPNVLAQLILERFEA
jgi:hypothetical protein